MILNKLCDLLESQVTCENFILYIYFFYISYFVLFVWVATSLSRHKWKDNSQESVLLRFSDLVVLPLVAGLSHQTCFCFLRQEFTTWSSLALNNATLPQPPNPPASLTSDVPTWVTSVISQGFMLSSPPQPQCEPKILCQPPGSRVP